MCCPCWIVTGIFVQLFANTTKRNLSRTTDSARTVKGILSIWKMISVGPLHNSSHSALHLSAAQSSWPWNHTLNRTVWIEAMQYWKQTLFVVNDCCKYIDEDYVLDLDRNYFCRKAELLAKIKHRTGELKMLWTEKPSKDEMTQVKDLSNLLSLK